MIENAQMLALAGFNVKDTIGDAIEGLLDKVVEGGLGILDTFNLEMLRLFRIDSGMFVEFFPYIKTVFPVLKGLGLGLVLLGLVWGSFKVFFQGVGIEAENPVKLFMRSILFLFLTYYSFDIMKIAVDIGQRGYNLILHTGFDINDFTFMSFYELLLQKLGNVQVLLQHQLLAIIATILLGWNYIKLLFEIAERYVLFCLLIFTCPLAFATGSTKGTSNIFKSWCRMIGGNLIIFWMNIIVLRMFTSTIIIGMQYL